MSRRAKILATLGPVCADEERIGALLDAGADAFRLNLSHGDHDWHRERLRAVRRAAEARGHHVPVILDLMGPRYRLGMMAEAITLTPDEHISLGPPDSGATLPVDAPELLEQLSPGDRMLIDQGLVELAIEDRRGDGVTARVVDGGEVSSRKGVNLPDADLGFRVTDKDRRDIAFAVAEGADYLAASYVGRAEDVEAVAREVRAAGGDIPLIAKLERARAVERLDEIVDAAAALMVARGDLGVEVPIHQVPVLQKTIIAAARRRGRPAIVATQMLESMIDQPRPTRAEATDVANATLDGADAMMLSGETAIGHHPEAAIRVMDRTIRAAEEFGGFPEELPRRRRGDRADPGAEIPDRVCAAAVYAAGELDARLLVAFTQSGATGRLLARYRPAAPIVVFANDLAVARRLALIWGVRPHHLADKLEHHDEVIQLVDRELLERGLAAPGETIVALMADPIRERTHTNLMRVHQVRTAESWRLAAG